MSLPDATVSQNGKQALFGLKITNNTDADIALGTASFTLEGTYAFDPGDIFWVQQTTPVPPTTETDFIFTHITDAPDNLSQDLSADNITVPANSVLYLFGLFVASGAAQPGTLVMSNIIDLTYPIFTGTVEDLQVSGATVTII